MGVIERQVNEGGDDVVVFVLIPGCFDSKKFVYRTDCETRMIPRYRNASLA
jgi:hypothetical protein